METLIICNREECLNRESIYCMHDLDKIIPNNKDCPFLLEIENIKLTVNDHGDKVYL